MGGSSPPLKESMLTTEFIWPPVPLAVFTQEFSSTATSTHPLRLTFTRLSASQLFCSAVKRGHSTVHIWSLQRILGCMVLLTVRTHGPVTQILAIYRVHVRTAVRLHSG